MCMRCNGKGHQEFMCTSNILPGKDCKCYTWRGKGTVRRSAHRMVAVSATRSKEMERGRKAWTSREQVRAVARSTMQNRSSSICSREARRGTTRVRCQNGNVSRKNGMAEVEHVMCQASRRGIPEESGSWAAWT